MSLSDSKLSESARASARAFRVAIEPLRPELFRYCRHLTRSAWDAEDLVQDTMARAFLALGSEYGQSIEHPRSWLFRVASNLWVDRVRRAREVLGEPPEASVTPDPRAAREAAGTLIGRLAPRERAALVLKEAFDLELSEIALILGTTTGAVKSALHRGRAKLSAPDHDDSFAPAPAVLDAFCKAFNEADLQALKALLVDSAIVELPGLAVDIGVAATERPESGILYHSLLAPLSAGVAERFLADYVPTTPPRAELRFHRGEHILLIWYAHTTGEAVRCFMRFEIDPDSQRIALLREYYHSPEALAEIATELSIPYRSNGYGGS